ncbi:MAG: transposase, partial [Chloroflexota bacterium]|nr:transposase [Chloroflexota bacterium]
VSSGGHRGFRVNLGGNRKLNRAFHIIALVQLRCNPLAKAYYARKRSEGKTGREALRCLKRQLVNVVYRLLRSGTTVLTGGVGCVGRARGALGEPGTYTRAALYSGC